MHPDLPHLTHLALEDHLAAWAMLKPAPLSRTKKVVRPSCVRTASDRVPARTCRSTGQQFPHQVNQGPQRKGLLQEPGQAQAFEPPQGFRLVEAAAEDDRHGGAVLA